MTTEQAAAILADMMRDIPRGVPREEAQATYLERLERLSPDHGRRVLDYCRDRHNWFPTLAQLREAIDTTTKPEYVAGERVSKRPPLWGRREIQQALRDHDRLLAMSDEEYWAYIEARRKGDMWTIRRMLDATEEVSARASGHAR